MRNVVPARALARRSRNWLLASILVILLGFLLGTVGLFMRTVRLVVSSNPNYSLYTTMTSVALYSSGLVILVGIVLAVRALTWKRDNPLAEAVANALADFLDDRYVYIRNLNRFALGYIDAVLVGPPGVLVFRITQRAGIFFNEGAYWMLQKDKGQWKTLSWSPTKECVDDIKNVRQFLQARGVADVPVFGVIVFTQDDPGTVVTMEKPVVPVLIPDELSYGLANTYFGKTDRLDQASANEVAKLLYG